MKKAIFTVLVVTLAALAVTCDNAIISSNLSSGPGQSALPPPNEPGTVTLSVGISDFSRARALVGASAQGAADFYEVVFVMADGTTTYRQSYNKTTGVHGSGGTATPGVTSFNITVGIDEYDNTDSSKGKAIILAGKADGDDRILLGIGTMTAITYNENDGDYTTQITKDTSGVTFTIYPLTAAVTNTASSSFLVTGFTGHSGDDEDYIDDIEIDSSTYPIFLVPENDEVTAVYNFACGATDGTDYVMITGAELYLTDAEDDEENALAATTSDSIDDAITPASDGDTLADAITSGFEITFETEDIDAYVGYCKLYIEVGVIAINATSGTWQNVPKVDWVIRGGLDNTDVDTTSGGTGGAVLLKVEGEPNSNTVSFPVDTW